MRILGGIVLVVGLAGAALAAVGSVRWGGAGWYVRGADYRLKCGQEALHRDNLARAERIVQQLEAGGSEDHAHLLRGEIYLRQKRIPQAVQELNRIRQDNEKLRLEAALIFGLGFLSLDRPHEAEHLLLYVVQHQPDNLEAHRGLATLYFDQGAKSLSVQHVREWVRLAPNDGNAHRFLGVLYSDFGDSNPWAISSFREALRCGLKPELTEQVKLELAELHVKQTDFAEALQALDGLAPEKAATQTAVELRCECLHGLNQVSELAVVLEQGLKDYPDSVPLLRLQALRLTETDPKAALAPLQHALVLSPHDPACRHQLAQVYEALGRSAEAKEQRRLQEQTRKMLDEMSKLSTDAIDKPWDAAVRIRLAELCAKLDKPNEAAMWRKSAAQCPPAPAGAAGTPKPAPMP
jgi:predicted Zn-dependent protease